MNMGNGIVLVTKKVQKNTDSEGKHSQLCYGEKYVFPPSTPPAASSESKHKIFFPSKSLATLRKHSKKEEVYSFLQKVNEPTLDLFSIFLKQKTFGDPNREKAFGEDTDSSKRESKRISGLSEASGSKRLPHQNGLFPNYNHSPIIPSISSGVVKRNKKTFRCQPDFTKGLSCEVDYLNYINQQACKEREEQEAKKKENEHEGRNGNVAVIAHVNESKSADERFTKIEVEKNTMKVNRNVSCFKKYVKPISLMNLHSEVKRLQDGFKENNFIDKENSIDSFNNNNKPKNNNTKNRFETFYMNDETLYKSTNNARSSPNIQAFLKPSTKSNSKFQQDAFEQTNSHKSPEQCTNVIDYNTDEIKNTNNNMKVGAQLHQPDNGNEKGTLVQKEQQPKLLQRRQQLQHQGQLPVREVEHPSGSPPQYCLIKGSETKKKETPVQSLEATKKTEKTNSQTTVEQPTLVDQQPSQQERAPTNLITTADPQAFQDAKKINRNLHLELAVNNKVEWKNEVFKLWREAHGVEDLYKKLKRRLKHHSFQMGACSLKEGSNGSIGSRTLLSLKVNRAKKEVTHSSSPIRQYNSVGAFGYGIVLANPCIPENDFFKPDLRFRIRLRHSSIQSNDDASSCPRETAIKFADQNEDGPLDLILHTGRVARADCCNSLLQIINLSQTSKLESRCRKDPLFKFALVDGTRKAPESYTSLRYYSHLTYLFLPSNNSKPRLAKFRLIPLTEHESGLLDEEEQKHPWLRQRDEDSTKSQTYLRDEFQKRMESIEAVKYVLQIQLTRRRDEIYWNPQMIWNENESPWLDLMRIQLTTTIPFTTLSRTYFNIVDKPSCLKFRSSRSANEFSSFQNCLSGMYTRFELDHMQSVVWRCDSALSSETMRKKRVQYYVTLCTAPTKDTKSMVDVYITLIGTKGRTAPQKLDYLLDEKEEEDSPTSMNDLGCENFVINTDFVGEILVVSLTVRHRHLTDEWFLMYLLLTDPERTMVRHFPCYNVVLSKVTLRPGEVSLPQKDCHELLRQERLLELRDRKSEYQWYASSNQPFGWIGAETVRDLPMSDRLQAEKYAGMPWDVDPTALETLLPFLATAASRGLLPNIPLFHRQTSATTDNFLSIGKARLRKARNKISNTPSAQAARRRWRKIRFAIAFITKVRIPDGPKGDMCRSVQDDVDFGRYFLLGPNPLLLKKVHKELPSNFPVTNDMCGGYLHIDQTLQMAIDDGNVYIIDYSILSAIPTIQKKADKRYLAAPLILFFEREFGDLIPLAIQLSQNPGPQNPIWTPKDNPEDWIMAKLWVKCADYHYHLAISHLFKSHFVVEPFAVGMMRQLSSSHPVYKLLKPHFRYTLVTNTLLRRHILRRNCALDKYTSIGASGVNRLMMKYLREKFVWDELDPRYDLESRDTLDKTRLPTYFYRDDALCLWDLITDFVNNILKLFYKENSDVQMDTELQAWIEDIYLHGFPGLFDNLSEWNTSENRTKKSDWQLSSFDEDEEDNDESGENGDSESVFSAPNENGSEIESKAGEESMSEQKIRISVNFETSLTSKESSAQSPQQTRPGTTTSKETERNDILRLKNGKEVLRSKEKVNSIRSSNSHMSSNTSFSSFAKSFLSKRSTLNRPLEDLNLPKEITTVEELSKLVTKLIFTATCQHSATHTEAMDLYGFIPMVPSMMRNPFMHKRNMSSREYITQTLPDQFPDAYYGSLSTLLQVHKPEENSLGDSSEMHFVEGDAKLVTEKFQNELKKLTEKIEERSRATGITYHNLTPTWIPNSVEPLPFLPKLAKEEAMSGQTNSDESSHIFMMTPSVPLSILPLCMYLARSNPGRGGGGKSSTSVGFNSGVDGVGVPKKAREDKMSMTRQKFNNMF